jgi:O-antigen ligase
MTSSVATRKNALQQSILGWAIFFLGYSTFLPVGLTYLTLILLLPILFFRSKFDLLNLDKSWLLLIALILIWPILTLPLNYNENFLNRYLHNIRFALCIIIAILFKNSEKISLLKGFVCGGIFATVIILINNIIAVPEFILWHNLLSVKGNASSQKWIMLAAMPAIFFIFTFGNNSRHVKYFIIISAAIVFFVVAYYSISRNSHIVLIGCLLAAVIYNTRSVKYWVYALGLTLLLSVFSLFFFGSISNRFEQLVAELHVYTSAGNFNSSVGVRAHMYITAWNTMLENWVFGSGLGSWEKIWFEASRAYPEMSGVNNPHNDFLLFGMENGVVGLATIFLFFIKIFFASWRNNNNVAASGWIIGWALMVTALVNAPFRDGVLGMMLVVLAVTLSENQSIDVELDIDQ